MSTPRIVRAFQALMTLCCLLLAMPSGLRAADTATSAPNLGVQEYEVAGVQVVLLSMKRTSDGYLTVTWAYRNTTDSPKKVGEDSSAMPGAWSARYSLALDMYAEADGQQYKPARTSNGDLVAATHAGPDKAVVVGPKQTLTTWAKLHAPPSSVTKANVVIQGAPPFEDIAISP